MDLDVLFVGGATAVSDAQRFAPYPELFRIAGMIWTVRGTPLRNTGERGRTAMAMVFRWWIGKRNT
ncbi:hypothetical protein AB0B25_28590 [Nocardia sp. NPDC049190]|uniref:hypothetical protein n=1 Tax=Nocardia sp. NPDC049190 TaxID=3155650 RepID=UPI0033DA7F96